MKKQGISLTRTFAATHPSQPNYLAAIAGDYFGCNHDEFARMSESVFTVADLLESKNISWGGYFEDLPGPGFMGDYSDGVDGMTPTGDWDYVRKHKYVPRYFTTMRRPLTCPSPFVTFDSVTNQGHRLLQLLSFNDYHRDFAAKRVPQFVFMTPNMMHDGHNTTLEVATKWSRDFIKPMLADKAFDGRTLVILTYDESETYEKPNQIATLLLGSAIPAHLRGTEDNTFYTHYSMLSTIEYNWDLPNLGRYDVGANVFKFVADAGGYKHNKDPENAAAVDNSLSYFGILHNETEHVVPIPRPNMKLIGSSGRGILEDIKEAWPPTKKDRTPYDGSGRVHDAGHPPVYGPEKANTP